MDLKVIPWSSKGHKFILVVIDEVTDFMVTVPIYQSRSKEIGDALKEHVFSKYSILGCMIMDQDSALMSTLINYLFKKLCIKIKTIAPSNHQPLQAEHGIKSLANILTKHLTGIGQYWPKYLPFAMYSYNTFVVKFEMDMVHVNYFSERNQKYLLI